MRTRSTRIAFCLVTLFTAMILSTKFIWTTKTSRDLADQLTLLQRQLSELTTGASKEVREATPSAAGSTAHRAGILNWTVEVPAEAMGDKASTIEYQYRWEFDKQLAIDGMMDLRK